MAHLKPSRELRSHQNSTHRDRAVTHEFGDTRRSQYGSCLGAIVKTRLGLMVVMVLALDRRVVAAITYVGSRA